MAYTTINKPSLYFNTLLWSGTSNSSARSFTGVGFKPDWVWQKVRTTTYGHEIFDIIRTTNRLASNTANAETALDQYGYISSFDTDGFTATPGSTDNTGWNEVGQNYVAWNWLASNTTTSNASGSITSTVSANTTAGFSVVGYTGAGGASTVGHGLGVAPKLVIVKGRSNSTRNWILGHNSLGWNKYMTLNSDIAVETNNYFNDTAPTSSVFSIFNSVNVNGSGETYIAYCFAEIKGYSKFGSYTGNGSTDGTFVYTGFKPAMIIIKKTNGIQEWGTYDNQRDTYNVVSNRLFPNLSSAQSTSTNMLDFTSNGFKPRTTNDMVNASSGNYIYMAFAENPFVSSTFIPTTAR